MSVDIKLVKELRDRTNLGMNDCKKALTEADGNIETAIDLLKKWGDLKGKEKASKIATEGRIGMFANNSASTVGVFEVNCQTDFVSKSQEFIDLMYSFFKMNNFSEAEFETKRQELVAKTGENIVLRRKDIFQSSNASVIRWYMHPGDRLGVLIEVSSVNMTKEVINFADECAMQVAAMSPLVANNEDVPAEMLVRQRRIFEEQLKEDGKPEQAWQKIIEGKFGKWRKEVVLMEQESIKDNQKSIKDIHAELVKQCGCDVKIVRFVRYALGEGIVKEKENYLEEVAKLMQ